MQCALRSVRYGPPRAARSLAASSRHRRHARLLRPFHTSSVYREAPEGPHNPVDTPVSSSRPIEGGTSVPETKNAVAPEANNEKEPKEPGLQAKKDKGRGYSPYGSGARRAMRNRKMEDKPAKPVAVRLPAWFHQRNMKLSDQSAQESQLLPLDVQIAQKNVQENAEDGDQLREGHGGDDGSAGKPEDGPPSNPDSRYTLSPEVWQELRAAVQAGLTLPAARYAHDPASAKPHLVLQYPGEGGILFLDAVVKSLATDLNTSVVTLNAQDIAELYGQQREENDQLSSSMMLLLGYDVYRPGQRQTQKEIEEEAEEREEEEDMEDEDSDRWSAQSAAVPVTKISADISGLVNPSILQSLFGGKGSFGVAKVVLPSGERKEGMDSDEDVRCLRLINELLDVPLGKRVQTEPAKEESSPTPEPTEPVESPDNTPVATTTTTTTTTPTTTTPPSQQPSSPASKKPTLILQIQDYKDILNTRGGSFFLSLLHKTVMRRRRNGDQIVIVGTVSEPESDKGHEKAFPRLTPRDYDQRASTIVVPPAISSKAAEEVFAKDAKKRIFDINIRHLKVMLKTRLRKSESAQSLLNDQPWDLDEELIRTSGLDTGYWPFSLVHRISTLTLGCIKPDESLTLAHITKGIELVGKSDQVKCDWLGERQNKAKPSKPSTHKDRRNKLRPKCNPHEEKLLNGVVDAETINTTFADVHVPPETKEALKTLTSLSLIRPEAFTYGVLATDKIPGLLLYGPPGTGKTMLAKAVARESGATVLEISGSDVYDMYVGEGEKNVRAIFTLAKKLTPCVVFIDEADAIFCSRTGASNRTSHRELINQFLREWDGMNSLSAFIMIATNRPFDLDDAVLRRLPRRLLVDLPTETDRLAILKIHLKDERLAPCVDLADIAEKTPFYSGSDLKNLSVAAALACVREENDIAAQHKGDEPYRYPEHRTLRKEHFEKAMEEISASISEDMSSLTAIRKFDEKYGDRKGRRKKAHGLGFSSPNAADAPGAETGRVRN
ncbi:spastin [Nannizzia gypsea CBS 118893]|uniref:Spastin n=1 Tax=Arthroderma gypseum (strain ATCC MYA-4604 / CBS 118893) TaxID=535722 RepID=E4UQL0_ARTGP|nr:spastin [Nannizzia gypsea CBS 118893]EFQ99239.1 spastin [Nannizzia gypsea CBS 118893]